MLAKYNKDFLRKGSVNGVSCKFNRDLTKMFIEINDKWLAWCIEQDTRLHPEKYSNMAEFIRLALTKESNSNLRISLNGIMQEGKNNDRA